jgi:hypothetical protein
MTNEVLVDKEIFTPFYKTEETSLFNNDCITIMSFIPNKLDYNSIKLIKSNKYLIKSFFKSR